MSVGGTIAPPSMVKRTLNSVLVCLLIAGILGHSLVERFPPGHSLCIGCDRVGWTISPSCAPGVEPTCCDADDEATEDHHDGLTARGTECRCFDVPIVAGVHASIAKPRSETMGGAVAQPLILATCIVAATIVDAGEPGWAAASPAPPRCLTPLDRRTVLVL